MRHLILILMIALLPLRSWSSDVMSIGMAARQLQLADNGASESASSVDVSAAQVATQTESQMAMSADCPFGTISQQLSADGNTKFSPFCKGCSTCHLCMALACGTGLSPVQTNAPPEEPRALLRHGFASADRALQLKPPIS